MRWPQEQNHPWGGGDTHRKGSCQHRGFLPAAESHTTPEDAQLTPAHQLGCRAAVTPYVQFSIKPAQSWFLGAFSFQSSMEKLEKELSLNPPCPQTPAHTHVQLSAVGICKAQVWFGGCCDGSEDSCSQWADPMTKRKKRRQTQVFNKTFINDFPGRTLALAQRVQQSRDCSELEKFILSTKHCKEQPSKAQYFPSTRRNNWAAGFWNFTVLLHIGIFLRHHSHTKATWTLGPFLQHRGEQCIAQAGAHRKAIDLFRNDSISSVPIKCRIEGTKKRACLCFWLDWTSLGDPSTPWTENKKSRRSCCVCITQGIYWQGTTWAAMHKQIDLPLTIHEKEKLNGRRQSSLTPALAQTACGHNIYSSSVTSIITPHLSSECSVIWLPQSGQVSPSAEQLFPWCDSWWAVHSNLCSHCTWSPAEAPLPQLRLKASFIWCISISGSCKLRQWVLLAPWNLLMIRARHAQQ